MQDGVAQIAISHSGSAKPSASQCWPSSLKITGGGNAASAFQPIDHPIDHLDPVSHGRERVVRHLRGRRVPGRLSFHFRPDVVHLKDGWDAVRDVAIGLWLLSQALVTSYGKVTFGDKSLTGGVVTATALVAACAAYVERAARVDGVAAVLGVPITAWSAFGDMLTEDLRERNPDLDGSEVPERYVRLG